MAKSKKKKNIDFQKVKLKVGRKLARDTNETRAEFKARKIVIKDVQNFHNDPVRMLSRHSESITHHSKLSMLNHFNSILTKEVVESLNKPILDSLCKFIVDHSEQIRAAAFRCIKSILNQMRQQHLSVKDFMESLRPYLDCAYSHVSRSICNDCQSLIDYLVKVNEPSTYETLMSVIARRFEAGNVSPAAKSTAKLLKGYYLRNQSKSMIEETLKRDQVIPFVWTKENFVLNIAQLQMSANNQYTDNHSTTEILLNQQNEKENYIEKFLELDLD